MFIFEISDIRCKHTHKVFLILCPDGRFCCACRYMSKQFFDNSVDKAREFLAAIWSCLPILEAVCEECGGVLFLPDPRTDSARLCWQVEQTRQGCVGDQLVFHLVFEVL